MLKIGFTGNQHGMTAAQMGRLKNYFGKVAKGGRPFQLHHGDCIGSDKEAHDFGRLFRAHIVGHPPTNRSKRAFCKFDEERPPLPYLDRNKNIVLETDLLIAMPREAEEQIRSGTWSTVRFARKMDKDTMIILPDGTFLLKEP